MFSAPNLEEVAGEREALASLLCSHLAAAYKAARLYFFHNIDKSWIFL